MVQPHDAVGITPSGHGLLGIVERDETGVLCHECGRWLGGLSYHLSRVHSMTVAEYRQEHQLPAGEPLVSRGTSALISRQASERVGSPQWRRFERSRDAVLPDSQKLATRASRTASAGTSARRARQAAERFTGQGQRRMDESRWDERLAAYVEHWQRTGEPPSQKAANKDARSLGEWMSHQWRAVYAGTISERRLVALREAGVPLDGDRGRKWRELPPPPP